MQGRKETALQQNSQSSMSDFCSSYQRNRQGAEEGEGLVFGVYHGKTDEEKTRGAKESWGSFLYLTSERLSH